MYDTDMYLPLSPCMYTAQTRCEKVGYEYILFVTVLQKNFLGAQGVVLGPWIFINQLEQN